MAGGAWPGNPKEMGNETNKKNIPSSLHLASKRKNECQASEYQIGVNDAKKVESKTNGRLPTFNTIAWDLRS